MSADERPLREVQDRMRSYIEREFDDLENIDDVPIEFVFFKNEQSLLDEGFGTDLKYDAIQAAVDTLDDVDSDVAKSVIEAAFGQIFEGLDDAGYALWLRTPDFETPVRTRSPSGVWQSVYSSYGAGGGTRPSDGFYEAVSQLTEDDSSDAEDNNWGHVDTDVFESLPPHEQETIQSLRNLILSGYVSPEVSILVRVADRETGRDRRENTSQ